MSQFSEIVCRDRARRWLVVVLAALSCLTLGFDDTEVSEARDRVIDEDYQTELPQFADAEPDNPLSFLEDAKREADEEQACDPEVEPNCEADQQRQDGEAGSSDSADNSDGSAKDGATSDDPGEETKTGSFWDHEAEVSPPEVPEPPDIDIPDSLVLVLQVLGISILVVIVLLVVWRIALAVSNRSDLAEAPESDAPASAGASLRDNAPTRPHDELAAEDHYDEAIHRLLLEVLDALAERQSGLSSPSLTARELLRRVRIDDASHQHLAALVRAVEEILFARRSADRAKYEACRDHHSAIMQAVDQRGAI